MMKYFIYVLKHTFDYKGRARRKEFWSFLLMLMIVYVFVAIINAMVAEKVPGFEEALLSAASSNDMSEMTTLMGKYMWPTFVFLLIALLPILSVSVRRLHDTGKPGWWIALYYGTQVVGNALALTMPMSKITSFLSYALMAMGILLLVWFFGDSEPGTNDYGPNPKGDEPMDVLE